MKIFKSFNRHSNDIATAPGEYRYLLNLEPNSNELGDGNKIVAVKGTEPITTVNAPSGYTTTDIIETNLGIFTFGYKIGSLHYAKLVFNKTRTEVTYQNFEILGPSYSSSDYLDIYTIEESERIAKMYIDVIKSKNFDDIQHYTFYIPLSGTPYLINTNIIELALPPITGASLAKGRLYSGLYSYSYRLLSKYGQYTRWAPLGDNVPVHLVSGGAVQGPEYINELENYQDAPITENGIKVTIPDVGLTADEEAYFTHVELLRVYKYSAQQVPIFEIVTILPFKNNTIVISDADSTQAIETLTFADFAVPLQYYKYKHKAVLNNRMFVVGIQDKVFPEIEFPDVRAFQFPALSGYTEYKVTTQIDDNIPAGTYEVIPTNNYKIDVGGTLYDIPTNSDVPRPLKEWYTETLEANEHLYPAGARSDVYGASGKNIVIRYTEISGSVISTEENLFGELKVNFNTEASPKVLQHTSLYRLGLIFIDSKGNESKVQIIGDIATPRFKPDELLNTVSPGVYMFKGKVFQITLVLGAAYAGYKVRLVYVPRTLADRRNLGLTYALPVYIISDRLEIGGTSIGASILYNTENLIGNIEINKKVDFLHYNEGLVQYPGVSSTKFNRLQAPTETTLYEEVKLNTAEPDSVNSIKYKIPEPETSVTDLPNVLGEGANHPAHLSKSLIYEPRHESIPYTGLLLQRNTNPYGGTLYATCANSKFVPFSDVITLDSSGGATFNSYGDTYMGLTILQLYHKGRTPANFTDYGLNANYVIMPVESPVNVDFVGDKLRKVVYEDAAYYLAPTGNIQYTHTVDGKEITKQLDLPNLYTMHSVFSTNILTAEYFIENNVADSTTRFPNMIRYSERKYLAEFKDNFRVFKPNNFNEIDIEWGEVTNLIVFRQKLLVFQERRLSIILVNETSQVIDNNDAVISLGSGDVLGIPGGNLVKTIAEDIGCSFKSNIIKSKSSIYWLDARNRHIYRYTGSESPQAITLLNNIQDLFKDVIQLDTQFYGKYLGTTGQVYMTILNKKTAYEVDTGVKMTIVDLGSSNYRLNGDTSNLTLYPNLEFMLYDNGVSYPVKVTSFDSSQLFITDLTGTNALTGIPYVLLYGIANKLNSFTIVYDEVLNTFTHILSATPGFYATVNRDLFMLDYYYEEHINGATSGTESSILHKLSNVNRNIFFGRLVQGIIEYVDMPAKGVFENIKFVTEMFENIHPRTVSWSALMNKTLSAIQLLTHYRCTHMLPIVPKKEEYTDYIDTDTKEVHPDNISTNIQSQLVEFKTVADVLHTNLHNAQKTGDIWSTQYPAIVSYVQENTPREDADGVELLDYLRSLYATVRLLYFPEAANRNFKITGIL